MRVLVTGANGFIGRHVLKALYADGHEVVCLDSSYPQGIIARTDESLWIARDITKPLPPEDGVDAIIHLAALSHPRQCDENPSKAFDVNVNGTHQVLKMALESGAKKVVFSSSAHVYDIPPRYLPTDEVHPLRLNNTYTTTKLLGEQLCDLFWQNHGLSYTTLRLFNAYGPGQQLGYFIPDMLAKARAGQIALSGGGTTKDWVYVEDVANAFAKALTSTFVGPINIGTGIETDLTTIARFLANETGADLIDQGGAKVTQMRADRRRAQQVLGWEPTKNIWEGLNAVLDASKVSYAVR